MAKIMVKIADVARLAGVSQSTASFVLNGHGDQMQISSETQERVWKAAKELNYKPSNLSHRIRSPKTKGVPAITNSGRLTGIRHPYTYFYLPCMRVLQDNSM